MAYIITPVDVTKLLVAGGGGGHLKTFYSGGGVVRYGNQKCRIYTLVSHTGITLPHIHELVVSAWKLDSVQSSERS
jgi:hypothetical protein